MSDKPARPRETLRQREAFEYYYSLGEGRTLKAVAQQFGVHPRTTYRWSKEFGWADRIAKRDQEIADMISEKRKAAILSRRLRFLRTLDNAIARGMRAVINGDLSVHSIGELVALMRETLSLLGEPDSTLRLEGGLKLDHEGAVNPLNPDELNEEALALLEAAKEVLNKVAGDANDNA